MAPRLTPLTAKTVTKVLEKSGFVFDRQRGSHRSYVKEGIARPVIVPDHGNKDIPIGTLRSIIRQSGMTLEEFLRVKDAL